LKPDEIKRDKFLIEHEFVTLNSENESTYICPQIVTKIGAKQAITSKIQKTQIRAI
jgi:hypothetical protein